MGDKTGIEWTDATWTPIRARFDEMQSDGSGKERVGWHCEHVSEGCRNCYAETLNVRLGTGRAFKPDQLFRLERVGYHNGESKLFLDPNLLIQPVRWKRPRRIFVCSMTDLFADFVPTEFIDQMFAVMAMSPRHTFQIVTKRPARMRAYLTAANAVHRIYGQALKFGPGVYPILPLPNVWLGTSVENQKAADERIPLLLRTPAAKRFLSAEPLLGPVNLVSIAVGNNGEMFPLEGWHPQPGELDSEQSETDGHPGLDWVIVGGESGRMARPMQRQWVRTLRDDCEAAHVPFFFKQWGEFAPSDDAPDGHTAMERVGKKVAGAFLDGREWREMPGRGIPA